MMKAVIDRFESDFAILILGEEEQRISVRRELLPEKSREGSWLQIDLQNGELRSAVLDEEETAKAKKRISEKLERLRRGEHLKK